MIEGSFLKRKEKIEEIWTLVAQMANNPPTMWETWVRSLGWKDSLEKGSATHSSILAWRIPWTEEPGRLHSMGLQRVRHDWISRNARLRGLGGPVGEGPQSGAQSLSGFRSESRSRLARWATLATLPNEISHQPAGTNEQLALLCWDSAPRTMGWPQEHISVPGASRRFQSWRERIRGTCEWEK